MEAEAENYNDEVAVPSVVLRGQGTEFGQVRTWQGLYIQEKIFLVASLFGVTASLVLTVIVLFSLDTASADFTVALALFFNLFIVYYFILHGVLKERSQELVVFLVALVFLIIYIVANYIEDQKWTDPVKLTRIILAGLFAPVSVVTGILVIKQYIESPYIVFRTVGPDATLQKACSHLFACISIIIFDVELQGTMLILVLSATGLKLALRDKIIIGIGTPFTIFWSALAYATLYLESGPVLIVTVLLSVLEPAYAIYQIIWVFSDYVGPCTVNGTWHHDVNISGHNVSCSDAVQISMSTTGVGVAAVIVRIVLVVALLMHYKNYGRGLNDKVVTLCSFLVKRITANDGHPSTANNSHPPTNALSLDPL